MMAQCTGTKDKNGLKQGDWKCYYDKQKTKVKSVKHYRDDIQHGEQKFYNRDGKLTSLRYMSNDMLCKLILVKKNGEKKTVMDLKCND
jgi:antitoxin component YwqK of YwqJK toxin-antitoxin module